MPPIRVPEPIDPTLKGLTPGLSVHYVGEDGTCWAGWVGSVLDPITGRIELAVWKPEFGFLPPQTAQWSQTIRAPGTWHWLGHP